LKSGLTVNNPSAVPESLQAMMVAAREVCVRVFHG